MGLYSMPYRVDYNFTFMSTPKSTSTHVPMGNPMPESRLYTLVMGFGIGLMGKAFARIYRPCFREN